MPITVLATAKVAMRGLKGAIQLSASQVPRRAVTSTTVVAGTADATRASGSLPLDSHPADLWCAPSDASWTKPIVEEVSYKPSQ